MKKARFITGVTILALLLALVPSALAGPPPGNWVSGIACQNLSETDSASITLYFYQEGNSTAVLVYNDPTPIPPNGSRNYYTPSSPPGVPEGFLGSVVVASNTPMACNVNTQTTGAGTTSDPYRMGTSAGFADTETSPTMYAPQVMKNLAGTFSSYIAVQNTTTAATNVTVSYKDRFGAAIPAATETVSIPGQSNHVFYQTDNANLPNGFLGAAVISAQDGTSGLAVTVNFYNSGSSSSTAQLHSYNGFASGANKLLVPRIVRNYYGYNGGMSIQNVGSSTTKVTIDFTFAGGSTYTYNSPNIAPGAALALYAPDMPALAGVDLLPVTHRFGSAVIQADPGGEIVAIINEDNRGGVGVPAERVGQGTTYNAILDGTQTDTVFLAQVPRKAGGIFSGGFQVANTTATAGTCSISYNSDTDANETNLTLPANGAIARYAPNVPNLNDGYNASVTVTCNRDIVAISNFAAEPGSGRYGDSFTQANGLNQ
jgi:hypothetical protein